MFYRLKDVFKITLPITYVTFSQAGFKNFNKE